MRTGVRTDCGTSTTKCEQIMNKPLSVEVRSYDVLQ